MLTPPAALVETMGMITGKAPEENFRGLATSNENSPVALAGMGLFSDKRGGVIRHRLEAPTLHQGFQPVNRS